MTNIGNSDYLPAYLEGRESARSEISNLLVQMREKLADRDSQLLLDGVMDQIFRMRTNSNEPPLKEECSDERGQAFLDAIASGTPGLLA